MREDEGVIPANHSEKLDDNSSNVEQGIAKPGAPYADRHGENVPWTATRMIAVASLCIVYVGSQIVLYFVSSALLPISESLETRYGNWMLTADTLAVAAICPFVGYITDLLGRRWVCLGGSLFLILASIIQATAHDLGQAVAAQAVGGIGAGICELTALAGSVMW